MPKKRTKIRPSPNFVHGSINDRRELIDSKFNTAAILQHEMLDKRFRIFFFIYKYIEIFTLDKRLSYFAGSQSLESNPTPETLRQKIATYISG